MALSFEDSLKAAQAESEAAAAVAAVPAVADDTSVMTLDYGIATTDYGIATTDESGMIAAYSGEDGSWIQVDWQGYKFYDEYNDENISKVDDEKYIKLDPKQFNITQETNSQYIPFEMPRYYDGFDLTTAKLQIYFVNEYNTGGINYPINVYYNDEKIRFGWLVDSTATQIAGKLNFEIQATGYNSKSERYIWKSRINKDLNVLQALEASAFVQPDDQWQEDFMTLINGRVSVAEQKAQEASTKAQEAADSAQAAADSAQEAKDAVANAAAEFDAEIETVVAEKVSEQMTGYATETYVEDALLDYYTMDEADVKIQEVVDAIPEVDFTGYATETYVNEAIVAADISSKLEGYYTKDEVDTAIENVDVSEQLGNLGTAEDGTPLTVVQYVDNKIADVDVSDQLTNYYTKTEIDTKTNSLSSSITTNETSISSLNSAVSTINQELASIDRSPRVTYKATYGDVELDDGSTAEHMFTLWKTENGVEEVQDRFQISGGGGSGTGSLKLFGIKYIDGYGTPIVTTADDSAIIKYEFVGEDSVGDTNLDGVASWKVGDRVVATQDVSTGECEFDLTKYMRVGDNKVVLTITHATGSVATKAWTIKVVDVKIKSDFNDTIANDAGSTVNFTFTPYGNIDKTIHFLLDGKEIATKTSSSSSSGLSDSYVIPAQEHGSHLFEIYMTADINGKTIESNHIVKDIIWYDESSDIPVIGTVYQTFAARQYETTNISYTVYDPSTETPKVSLVSTYINEDGETVEEYNSNVTMSSNTDVWQYNTDIIGEHTLTITCGETVKTLIATISELGISVSPVTTGLEFDFKPVGYSNGDENRLWSDGNVDMVVSDNFDWVNGGYQIDENGDRYFCVKAGTNAVINYNLFADDPKKTGKEFKVIFRTKNIRKRDTSFLTCIDDGIGLDMKVENATVYNNGGSLKSHYCEDEIIEYEFNINKDSDMMIVMSYEDGAPSVPCEYTETSSFKQTTPKPITIGSEDCDVLIYRMKAYSVSLTDTDIKNNFIADARNANEMIARYTRNQIYDDGNLVSTSASGDFSADALMKAAPDLRYIFLEVPQFTNDKDNKIDGCTVYFRYPNGTRPQDNWDCTGVRHRGQGTSSNLYGYSGRNIDLCMDRDESLFTWVDEDGKTVESSTVTLTDTSVPTDYLNIKVNIASSENENNAQMARRFNEYQPFLRYARKKDSRVKDTMEFYNCVVFIRETSEDPSVPHREFNDTNWHFYGIGNVGDSKKTDDTRVNNKRDPKEHVIEITDADKPLSAFPTGKEGHTVCPVEEWKEGNSAYDVLYSNEYVYDEEGAFESFGGKTYEFRYEMKDITDEQRQSNIDTWRELYKFIATSTDEEFYAHLKDYFVVDSALYYYLFTERYTMVDNRAKNSFWHYGKVYISNEEAVALGETEASYYIVDDEAAAINEGYRYDLTFGYDFDTCLGIDNTGDYVFSYGKEDTDYYVDGDPSSDYVFRVADSVFFCRLRDLFPSEMQAMFKDRESKNAWDSNSLITQWDNAQAQFPEELWRLDYERKYYRTYLGLSIDNSIAKGIDKTFLIGKFFGRKKYARRAFEINQEIYFATKYFGNKALSDVFWIRGNVPIGSSIKPNYSLTLVPYSDMYVCVQYTSTGTPIHKKVKAGETCVFENDAERMDFIYVYAASYIQEVGDLSRCYVGDNNFSSATRLQKLVIGSVEDGYENTFMKEVLVANNTLLEYLDLRNVSGIDTEINVSGCGNLKELYAEGTNASGAIFANGGLLRIAHLPKITKLSMKNLNYIEDFAVDGYENLQTLIVENTPNINTYDIVCNAPLLKTVRLIGLNWDSTYQIKDASIFDRLLTIGGFDSFGYETDLSVLTGNAHVVVLKQQQSYNYQNAWSDLKVTSDSLITQHAVTFINDDGTILEIQYVDNGSYAVDPLTRDENPLSTPTKESTVSTDYTFAGWNMDLSAVGIREPKTVTATYTESVREYTIKYVSKGNLLQEDTVPYGTNVVYEGDMPTYTLEEGIGSEHFYLFSHWDKSGIVDGNKTVNAVFEDFQYSEGAFEGKELSDMSAVEIYALTRLVEMGVLSVVDIDDNGSEEYLGDTYQTIKGTNIQTGDAFSFTMGYDIDYNDIKSVEIVSEKTTFDGTSTSYIDTGILLFDEDKDFVLAIDYKIHSDNDQNDVFMQCFQSSGTNGFKLVCNTNPEFTWGGSSMEEKPASVDAREMLVIRHKAGDNNLYVYTSNLNSTSPSSYTITKSTSTETTTEHATLVLGASKNDNGTRFTNHCKGDVYWCKVWFMDLGDEACEKLVGWTREEISMQVSGFYRYQLYGDYNESTISFLSTHLLDRKMQYNTTNTNSGGWASSSLRHFLNSRFYDAIPDQIKYMMKKVTVTSTIGDKSSESSESGCYVVVPAVYDLDSSFGSPYTGEVYDTNGTIDFMVDNNDRKRAYVGGDYAQYWTRSPNASASWNYCIDSDGACYGYLTASTQCGVLVEISF